MKKDINRLLKRTTCIMLSSVMILTNIPVKDCLSDKSAEVYAEKLNDESVNNSDVSTEKNTMEHRYDTEYGYNDLKKRDNAEAKIALYDAMEQYSEAFSKDWSDLDSTIFAKITIEDIEMTENDIFGTYTVFKMDNPQYYWLADYVSYEVADGCTCVYMNVYIEYMEGAVRKENDEIIEAKVQEYANLFNEASTDYEIALGVHDKIIKEVDYEYLEDNITPSTESYAHSILGVFNGEGVVCEGYAKAYQMLMNYFGVVNIYVIGFAGGNTGDNGEMVLHAWNYLKMDDGNYYGVDVTWDDFGIDMNENYYSYEWYTSPYYKGGLRYEYFLKGETFYDAHWSLASDNEGYYYMYDLPQIANNDYEPKVEGEPVGSTFLAEECMTLQFQVIKNTENEKQVEVWMRNELVDDGVLVIPSEVTYNGIKYDVIGIGEDFCRHATDFSKLIISEGVEYIADGALLRWEESYSNKIYMEELYLPSSLEYIGGFNNQINLKKIVLDEDSRHYKLIDDVLYTYDLKVVVMHAACSEIEEITLPDEVEKIGLSAFAYSKYLKKINFNDNLKVIRNEAFYACEAIEEIVVPESVELVAQNAFLEMQSVKNIYIEGADTQWHAWACVGCPELEAVYVNDENTYVRDEEGVLFSGDVLITYPGGKKDKEYVVRDGIEIYWQAFMNTSYLETVYIGANTNFDVYSFVRTGVSNLVIDENHPSYCCEDGIVYNKDMTVLEFCLGGNKDKEITINDTVEIIGESAFQQCNNIEILNIPNNVKTIEGIAFFKCQNLREVYMEDGVTKLESNCFEECDNLETVVLSDKIVFSEEDKFIFYSCDKLKSIKIPSETTLIPSFFITNCNSVTEIYIPENVKEFCGLLEPAWNEWCTVYCFKDSYAHKQAEWNGWNYNLLVEDDVIYGDATIDGKINVLDAVLMKKHIAGYENLTINLGAADVNADTRVNVMDAVMVLKYIAGFDVVLGR